MYQRIVVPLDGSDLAALAVPEARTVAQCGAIPLHLVRVVDLARLDRVAGFGPGSGAAIAGRITAAQAQAAAELAATAAPLRAQGLAVTTAVRPGSVVDELLALAQPGDLFVLATHGRSGVTRWLLGSVAEALARQSVVRASSSGRSSPVGLRTVCAHRPPSSSPDRREPETR